MREVPRRERPIYKEYTDRNKQRYPSPSASPASGHPIDDTALAGRHVASEAIPITTKHVECYDCHNPHAVKAPTGVLGDRDGGRVQGMKFVDISGWSGTRPQAFASHMFTRYASNATEIHSTRSYLTKHGRAEAIPCGQRF